MATITLWARRAVLPLAVVLFVDLGLGWHRASVSLRGALHVQGDTSAVAGWGLLAAVAVGGLIVWEMLRSTGTSPADRSGTEGLSAALAFSALVFTAIEFFADSATVDVAGLVNASAQNRLWPAYVGLSLAVLLALATVVQLARPVRTGTRGASSAHVMNETGGARGRDGRAAKELRTMNIAHALRPNRRSASHMPLQVRWLAGGAVLAFGVPFLFADVLAVPRDAYYAVYIVAVFALFGVWAHFAGGGVIAAIARRWRLGVGLGLLFAVATALMAIRVESATSHPHGLRFVGAIVWRGIAYGLADGLLLTSFPVLAVFAAFAGRKILRSARGKAAVGVLALAASLAFTAVYHAGYPEFRGGKIGNPVRGDVVWSVPTLATLNPLGAPIAHVGLHVGAVVHSYDTDLFLPPHEQGAQG